MRRILLLAVFVIVLAVILSAIGSTAASAQTPSSTPAPLACNAVLPQVEKVLSAVDCSKLDHDQVCYGNRTIMVAYQDPSNAAQTTFVQPGDVAPISAIKTLATSPLDLQTGEWGVALLKVQANLPGVTAGQAVTFVLYGNANLTDRTPRTDTTGTPTPTAPTCTGIVTRATYLRGKPGPAEQQIQLLQANTSVNLTGRLADNSWVSAESQGASGWIYSRVLTPACDLNSLPVVGAVAGLSAPAASTTGSLSSLRAFYFSTGIGTQAGCNEVPSGGMLIQSPSGHTVKFNINGADLTIGSTVRAQAQNNRRMTLTVLDGHATVNVGGKEITAVTGQDLWVPLGGEGGLNATGVPNPPQPSSADPQEIAKLCQLARAAGLTIPCTITPLLPTAPPPRPIIPRPLPSGLPSPVTLTPSATTVANVCTFTVQNFSAKPNPVNVSAGPPCTTVSWDVEGVDSVFLNGQGVVGHGAQQFCNLNRPAVNFTLTLNCGGKTQTKVLTVPVG